MTFTQEIEQHNKLVKDLKTENKKLKKENAELREHHAKVCKELTDTHRNLKEHFKEQIEKMKCCENCKHKKSEVDRCELLMYSMNACLCKNKDKWELKE